jgi:hypothetical protein
LASCYGNVNCKYAARHDEEFNELTEECCLGREVSMMLQAHGNSVEEDIPAEHILAAGLNMLRENGFEGGVCSAVQR